MTDLVAPLTFPTKDEALALIPEGRYPYALTREVLAEQDEDKKFLTSYRVAKAIQHLAAANELGILEPPLPEPLAEVVAQADCFVENGRPMEGFNVAAARTLLAAVYEHGYRSDR